MSIIVEDGSGVAGAVSYQTLVQITAYWTARQNRPEYDAWTAAATAVQEGASIEASSFADAVWGGYYRGARAGFVQGLLWPRTGACDEAGYPLPGLPPQLAAAVCELSGRAVTAPLSADAAVDGAVKRSRLKVGSYEKETEYFGVASAEKKFGVVAGIIAGILNGSQPGAPGGNWAWA